MNRRQFLKLGAMWVPAAVVAPQLGVLDKIRKYFFAPRGGWRASCDEFIITPYAFAIPIEWTKLAEITWQGEDINVPPPLEFVNLEDLGPYTVRGHKVTFTTALPPGIGPGTVIMREVPRAELKRMFPVYVPSRKRRS